MDRKITFPKINSKIYKFSVFFPARYPVPALPEPKYKFLFPVPLTPYTIPVSPVGLLIPFTAISRKLPLALSLAFFGITSMDCLALLFCFSGHLVDISTAHSVSCVNWNVY